MDGVTEMTDHLGGCYPEGDANLIMHDVWGWLIVEYDVKSCIDVGCGYGHALDFIEKLNVSSEGVDGYEPAVAGKICGSPVYSHDYTLGDYPKADETKWDLAWSGEFLEHVEERYLPHIMHTFKACKHVCATHAEPGQIGFHHVNCQTTDYWVTQFEKYGFAFDEGNTKKLRQTDRWHTGWGRRTLMLFHNEN